MLLAAQATNRHWAYTLIKAYENLDLCETLALARALSPFLKAGDLVALEGPLGAGKSAFARELVRTLLADPDAEVPSPTFTLVQPYDRKGAPDIYHADLYRLSDAEELYELGLEDARPDAIMLIEWPDRLEKTWRDTALNLSFSIAEKYDDDGENLRHINVDGDADWQQRLGEMP